jgi:hypothetical protein
MLGRLARAAPFLAGAVAAAIWLRRRQPERPALPVSTGTARGAEPAEPAEEERVPEERAPVDIVTVVDDLLDPAR